MWAARGGGGGSALECGAGADPQRPSDHQRAQGGNDHTAGHREPRDEFPAHDDSCSMPIKSDSFLPENVCRFTGVLGRLPGQTRTRSARTGEHTCTTYTCIFCIFMKRRMKDEGSRMKDSSLKDDRAPGPAPPRAAGVAVGRDTCSPEPDQNLCPLFPPPRPPTIWFLSKR